MNEKTPNQSDKKLYKFLQKYYATHGYIPSYQEMVDHTSAKSKGHISEQIKNLEKAGWLQRTPNKPRAIKLNKQAAPQRLFSLIPLAGVIQAGAPIPLPGSDFAMFLPDEAVDVGGLLPESALRKELFALRVQGDSMVDSNIQDMDTVIMEPVSTAKNGDMVAAWLPEEEEATLKHYFREKDRVRLQPANPAFEPYYCHPSKVEVQGRVVMVIRSC
ncbi:MAG TPA: transcriptional repressor LexA [Anaerolineales bacterium]|nr:transcriptional repressor LexA [Anaerolineales bacterium]